MGMFDEIRCDYPLPNDPPAFASKSGYRFQTKALNCELEVYTISSDGGLYRCNGSLVPLTGDVSFYTSNSIGSSHGVEFTANGEDSESVEYLAVFHNGRLQKIHESERTRVPALAHAELNGGDGIREHPETDRIAREGESLLGRKLFLLWGGQTIQEGVEVMIVFDGPKEWAIQDAFGRLEVIPREHRDNILFDSREAAASHRDFQAGESKQKSARLAALLAEKTNKSYRRKR